MTGALQGRRIALLETREADRFAAMLCEEGAEVVACPAVAIAGPADPAPVIDWLGRLIAAPFDDLILLTGEGVYRLRDLARSAGLEPPFLAELGQTPHDQPRPEAGSSAAGARAAAAIARRAADDGPSHRAAFGRRYAGRKSATVRKRTKAPPDRRQGAFLLPVSGGRKKKEETTTEPATLAAKRREKA